MKKVFIMGKIILNDTSFYYLIPLKIKVLILKYFPIIIVLRFIRCSKTTLFILLNFIKFKYNHWEYNY